jgi:hypothetical protein
MLALIIKYFHYLYTTLIDSLPVKSNILKDGTNKKLENKCF